MANSIIIDGNNIMYRALRSFNLSYNGKSTSIIYGVPNIIRALITTLSAKDVYVVFDGGKSQYRLDILPTYKKRDKGADFDYKDFKRQKDIVIKVLRLLGIPVICIDKQEADDIIWLLARRLKRKNKVIIVSTDKDFHQLLSPKVSIWNTQMNKRVTHKNLFEMKGYRPHETVDYLILDGDASDKIPGVPGMGKVTIRKFLDDYRSIKNYLISDYPQFRKFDKRNMEEVYLTNRKLIDLRLFMRDNNISFDSLGIKDIKPKKPGIRMKKLNLIIAKYDLQSFNRPNFLKSFKQLEYESKP